MGIRLLGSTDYQRRNIKFQNVSCIMNVNVQRDRSDRDTASYKICSFVASFLSRIDTLQTVVSKMRRPSELTIVKRAALSWMSDLLTNLLKDLLIQ